jgi:hypothetical protein
MKCSNPNCSHGIGLVSYRRGWFNKRRFCSKKCRDDFKVEGGSRRLSICWESIVKHPSRSA